MLRWSEGFSDQQPGIAVPRNRDGMAPDKKWGSHSSTGHIGIKLKALVAMFD